MMACYFFFLGGGGGAFSLATCVFSLLESEYPHPVGSCEAGDQYPGVPALGPLSSISPSCPRQGSVGWSG